MWRCTINCFWDSREPKHQEYRVPKVSQAILDPTTLWLDTIDYDGANSIQRLSASIFEFDHFSSTVLQPGVSLQIDGYTQNFSMIGDVYIDITSSKPVLVIQSSAV